MFSLESDEMTALCPNDSSTLIFYVTFSKSIPNWTTFVKEVFYIMISLDSDKLTPFWPNDSLSITFYATFSNSIPNWETFVKEVFWFYV